MNGKSPRRVTAKYAFQHWPKRKLFLTAFLSTLLVGTAALTLLVILVSSSPQTGAHGADWLRSVFGNRPVAQLESLVFTIQDRLHQLAYHIEDSTPSVPWAVPAPSQAASVSTSRLVATPTGASLSTGSSAALSAPLPPPAPAQPASPTPTASPPAASIPWQPANLRPLGNIPGEGAWSAYIQDASGATVSYRTFLQPDPARPYVTVGIVALDLSRVRLHYALGITEPVSSIYLPRTGKVPTQDQAPGALLAAFNGGFKTVHGNFGVFAEHIVLVPPIDGMGTLAIYDDGTLRIGEWGRDMSYSPDMLVYRQNCPLMVQDGQVNPLVYNSSVNDWGGTISGNIVTFRSGIGLSRDGSALYYFAGSTLTMPALASAMQAAGAYQAMQLDINNYYVHFTSFELRDGRLSGFPLLPEEMVDNIDRYLDGFAHDFFYVTAENK